MAKMLDRCPEVHTEKTACSGRTRIQALLEAADEGRCFIGQTITVCGWAKSVRKQGAGQFCFVTLNDGSTLRSLQVVVDQGIPAYENVLKASAGCSFRFMGTIVQAPENSIQKIEMSVKDPAKHCCVIYGDSDAKAYPLSKKHHSREYLREIAHLRPRTSLIGCLTRLRSQMAMATHKFFQDRGFLYIHTPIITAADCEGAGELFQVTTLGKEYLHEIPTLSEENELKKIDYKKDFFGKPAYLTVSGQLSVENFCCALGDVYTFGPTFRAENSHTSRHLAEFWMIEPELAFADLSDNMECAESYLKYCVTWALQNCKSDIEWCDEHVENGLIERLKILTKTAFERLTYTDVIEKLKCHNDEFTVKVEWGSDLGAEHERYLTEVLYKQPVIVYNYPKDFKAFYMRQNEDGRTVAAMDVLLPKIGEVIGGSQREERLDKLQSLIKEKGLEVERYWWYLELRKYGTIPHSGFGLGFERLLMTITGIENIRDVIPFPRYPGHAEF